MKRDMDLIRTILLQVEDCAEADGNGHLPIELDGREAKEIIYHVKLLGQAGLIEISDHSYMGHLEVWPSSLTWEGHEFLDAIRKDSIWQKAKKTALDTTGSMSFQLIK